MKKILTLLFPLLFVVPSVLAHQDFIITEEFGVVKTQIITGYHYEEIQKVYIIGVLAEKLAGGLNYSGKIFLNFRHAYTSRCDSVANGCDTDYFLGFDKGVINEWQDSNDESPLDTAGIVIHQLSKQFDIKMTLKLLEYAIKNIQSIKLSQKKIEFKTKFTIWKLNSISPDYIYSLLIQPESKLIQELMNSRVYRSKNNSDANFTYYWQNSHYHIIRIGNEKSGQVLLKLPNIYDFRELYGCLFVFESKNWFYSVRRHHKNEVSKKWEIYNIEENYKPMKIEHVGQNIFSMYCSYYSFDQKSRTIETRVLIYQSYLDQLVQGIETFFGKE